MEEDHHEMDFKNPPYIVIAQSLKDRGHQFDIFSLRNGSNILILMIQIKVAYKKLRPRINSQQSRQFVQNQIDLINHANLPFLMDIGCLCS